jgi:hypothetical protein
MPLAGWLDERAVSARIALVALSGVGRSLWLAGLPEASAPWSGALALFGAGSAPSTSPATRQGIASSARTADRSFLVPAAFSAGGLIRRAAAVSAARTRVDPRRTSRGRGHARARCVRRGPSPPARRIGLRDVALVRPPRALLLLVAPHSSRWLPRARGRLERRLPPRIAWLHRSVAALGYTAFSLAMVASRLAGDRLDETIGPAALAGGGGVSPPSGSRSARDRDRYARCARGLRRHGCGPRGDGSRPSSHGRDDARRRAGIGIAAVSTIGFSGSSRARLRIGIARRRDRAPRRARRRGRGERARLRVSRGG